MEMIHQGMDLQEIRHRSGYADLRHLAQYLGMTLTALRNNYLPSEKEK